MPSPSSSKVPSTSRRLAQVSAPLLSRALRAKFGAVKLFLCDVDGVLTDGTVFMAGDSEAKQFNILDGLGLRLLQRAGIKVGWISGRPSPATRHRAHGLQIDFLKEGEKSKAAEIESILAATGLSWKDVSYMGDDILDLAPLKRAGLSIAVANAIPEAKSLAHYVTKASGGRGAIREVTDLILKAQQQWDRMIQSHTEGR